MSKRKSAPEILDFAQLQMRRHEAASAMLAALKAIKANGYETTKTARICDAAIAQAEVAGIT